MTNDTRAEDRQALERLLEIYGAERTRWPARERLRFAALVAEDAPARRLLAEAAALDGVLDRASRPSGAREEALKERIMAAALRSSGAKVSLVAAPKHAPWSARPLVSKVSTRGDWPAAALLAASLVVGVVLGSAGTFNSTMQDLAEAAGISTSGDSSQLALGEEVGSADEDLL